MSVNGQPLQCIWSSTLRTWSPVVSFNFQPATPMNSPPTVATVPITLSGSNALQPLLSHGGQSSHGSGSISQSLTFSGLTTIATEPQYTAREFLDSLLPLASFRPFGVVYVSSAANELFGLLGPFTAWELPQDLGGYLQLPAERVFYPLNRLNPTRPIDRVTEADAIDFAMRTIFEPVQSVINIASGQEVFVDSESTHSVQINDSMKLVSRVDKSWSFSNGARFVVMEFKRPGALKEWEWFPTNRQTGMVSTVIGGAAKICRQLKKYCLTYKTRYCAVCDVQVLIEMYLKGDPNYWMSDIPRQAPTTPARIRWIKDNKEMKREWFVFAIAAMKWKSENPDFMRIQ